MTARNLVLNLVYYSATVIALPAVLLHLENRLGLPRLSLPELRISGVILASTAAGSQLWCIALFQRIGKGTPSPLWPPRELVRQGPYRWLRNPLNLGETMLFVAIAMWFGSPALAAYAVGAWLVFHAFVVYHEERDLARRFGPDYEDYCRRVGRWWPGIGAHESRRPKAS